MAIVTKPEAKHHFLFVCTITPMHSTLSNTRIITNNQACLVVSSPGELHAIHFAETERIREDRQSANQQLVKKTRAERQESLCILTGIG